MSDTAEHTTENASVKEGALHLLVNCVGVKPGDSVLLVGERGAAAFFDPWLCQVVASIVEDLGANSRIVIARDPGPVAPSPPAILGAMQQVDHVAFFSRLGDRIRFTDTAARASRTMCHVHDLGYLASAYGRIPYGLFEALSAALVAAIGTASRYTIECPFGTALEAAAESPRVAQDFTVKQFPVLIVPPLSCRGMTGRIALSRFLISTSTDVYDDSLLVFDHVVLAIVENGRMTGLEGSAATVARIRRHFDRVADRIGGDPYALNSRHAGFCSPTYFAGRAEDDIERWGDIAFGSPRHTHMHACGSSPWGDAIPATPACCQCGPFPTIQNLDGQRQCHIRWPYLLPARKIVCAGWYQR